MRVLSTRKREPLRSMVGRRQTGRETYVEVDREAVIRASGCLGLEVHVEQRPLEPVAVGDVDSVHDQRVVAGDLGGNVVAAVGLELVADDAGGTLEAFLPRGQPRHGVIGRLVGGLVTSQCTTKHATKRRLLG